MMYVQKNTNSLQIYTCRENQRILIETIQQENTKFGECQALTEVTDCVGSFKFIWIHKF